MPAFSSTATLTALWLPLQILDLLNAAPDDGGRKPHDADMETAAQRRIAQLEEELRLSKQQNDVLQRDYMHRLN